MNEPVSAVAPSACYRIGKFIRRNRIQLGVGTVVAVVLILAFWANQSQTARVERLERSLEQQSEIAELATQQAKIARAAEAQLAEELRQIYRVRLGNEPSSAVVTHIPDADPSFRQQIISEDFENLLAVPSEVCESYLALNQTNAESMLAAYQVMDAPREFLHQVVATYPDNPQVLFTAVSLDLYPEEKRFWIERFKLAAEDNALPLYLSARAYLEEGNIPQAFEELQAAGLHSNIYDYSAERIQALEEIYLHQGRSPAEAKTVGTLSLILPHLAPLRDLGKDLAQLQAQYIAQGDYRSAETMAQLGTQLGRELSSGSGANYFVGRKIGLKIERAVLAELNPQHHYDWLDGTPSDRLAQMEAEQLAINESFERSNPWLSQASDAEVISYFDRIKIYGEAAANHWVDLRDLDK